MPDEACKTTGRRLADGPDPLGPKRLTGQGAAIDTTTAQGRFAFTLFAALAEFERDLIVERTRAGLASARARGRKGGWPYAMTAAKLRTAQAAMGQPETRVGALCRELGVTRQTLYRHVGPMDELRPDGEKLLAVGRGRDGLLVIGSISASSTLTGIGGSHFGRRSPRPGPIRRPGIRRFGSPPDRRRNFRSTSGDRPVSCAETGSVPPRFSSSPQA